MPSLISHLSHAESSKLLDDLNYLNTAEYHAFCKLHGIPFVILLGREDGTRIKSKDKDRKAIILERIRHFLLTGTILPPTCYAASIVQLDGLEHQVEPHDRLYYGCYDKKHPGMMQLLRDLTNGQFRDGAIARILANEFWTDGKAPTFREFAHEWMIRNERGLGSHPEAAWLTDRANKTAGDNWKAKRTKIANSVLKQLSRINV